MVVILYFILYKMSYFVLNIMFINIYIYEDIFVGCFLKKKIVFIVVIILYFVLV